MSAERLDHRIGCLIRDGIPIYYAFVGGYDRPATEGTLGEVEHALGLQTSRASNRAVRVGDARQLPLRHFAVTVTPTMIAYCGAGQITASVVPVIARTHAEALKKARAEYRLQEGRLGIPVSFRVKLAPE